MGSKTITTTLGKYLTFKNGKKSPEREGNGEFYVFGSNGKIGRASETNSLENTVIIGRVGTYCGSVQLSEKKCWVTDNAISCTLKANENIAFWFYLLKHLNLNQYRSGSGQPLLNQSILNSIQCVIPANMEYRDGAGRYLLTIDNKIHLNRQINQTLEQMAQALFKSWFVDFDPVLDNALDAGNLIPDELQERAEARQAVRKSEGFTPLPADVRQLFPAEFEQSELGWVPKGWETSNIGFVSECFDKVRVPLSKKQREDKKPGIYPYHGATSVMDYISEYIFDDIYLLIGEDGSVIKADGTPFCQYIWDKCWVNNHAHVLKGRNGISTEHLMIFMMQANIRAFVTGAVQMKINQKNMNSIPFLLATKAINNHFSDVISPLYSKFRSNHEQNSRLEKLRDTLLPKLISGELRLEQVEAVIAETNTEDSTLSVTA